MIDDFSHFISDLIFLFIVISFIPIRDPFVFGEDKNLYLLYVSDGEQAIKIANLKKIKNE